MIKSAVAAQALVTAQESKFFVDETIPLFKVFDYVFDRLKPCTAATLPRSLSTTSRTGLHSVVGSSRWLVRKIFPKQSSSSGGLRAATLSRLARVGCLGCTTQRTPFWLAQTPLAGPNKIGRSTWSRQRRGLKTLVVFLRAGFPSWPDHAGVCEAVASPQGAGQCPGHHQRRLGSSSSRANVRPH